jgi:hypothetical protein
MLSTRPLTGTEYPVDMSRIRRRCFDPDYSDRSARADILLLEEPDEEEDDEGDDDEEDDGGYTVRVCRLCQW